MKSTHNTVHAYGISALAMLAMVTGTAVMIAACSSVKPPPKMFDQTLLSDRIQKPDLISASPVRKPRSVTR